MATGIKRIYTDFKGVDFLQEASLVNITRSPDALNVWKNYEDTQGACIETRPGYRKLAQIGTGPILGIYVYSNSIAIIHSGNKLYEWNNFPNRPENSNIKEIYSEMNDIKSYYNKIGEKLYINDGKTYLVYYSGNCKKVIDDEPFIPLLQLVERQEILEEEKAYKI